MQVRATTLPDEGDDDGKMIIEGKAVTFDEATVLMVWGDTEYKEIISAGAFDETDMSNAYLKYNHSDNIMAMARYKNGTLEIDVREDGVYIKAELADTTAGRDLYALVKRGDIDKMSFAFTIEEESYNDKEHTWTVLKVDRLYDVAAVTVPAYENTDLYARRAGEVEAMISKVETKRAEKKRQAAQVLLKIRKNKNLGGN